MNTIVVGVDGSEESKQALRWALDEARLRGARARAVYAWLYPLIGGRGRIPLDVVRIGGARVRARGSRPKAARAGRSRRLRGGAGNRARSEFEHERERNRCTR